MSTTALPSPFERLVAAATPDSPPGTMRSSVTAKPRRSYSARAGALAAPVPTVQCAAPASRASSASIRSPATPRRNALGCTARRWMSTVVPSRL